MSDSVLLAALAACHQDNQDSRPNFSRIAQEHQVDRNTLRRQYEKSLRPITPKDDPRSLLSLAQEKVVLDYLEYMGKRNLFVTPQILRNLVQSLVGVLPSESWARRFIARHSGTIKTMVVGGMEAVRHSAEYRPVFEAWFDLVSKLLVRQPRGNCYWLA